MDVGLNVTSVLSSFSGNGNFLEPQNLPFLLRFGKKSKIRFGLGLRGTSDSFFDNITNSFRESSEQEYYAKVGFEQVVMKEGRWDFYVGVDVLGQYIDNTVLINPSDNNASSRLTKRTIGGGVSPLAGVKFYIGHRIYLSAEANFTFVYVQNKRTETNPFEIEPVRPVTTTSEGFAVSPPLFLYLNYQL